MRPRLIRIACASWLVCVSGLPAMAQSPSMDQITMTLWLASIKAIPAFFGSFVLLLLAWGIGQRITTAWNIRQKQKENNLENAREFHRLYGEFIAIWRLWNYFIS